MVQCIIKFGMMFCVCIQDNGMGHMPHKMDEFLNRIRNIESNNGLNTDHSVIQNGIHAGDSAIGEYGLMPNTIHEIINRKKRLNNYGPDEALTNMMENGDQLRDFMDNNPRIQRNLATTLADKVLNRQKGDEDRAAYAWNQGSNLHPDDISDDALDNSPYVEKFRRLKELMGRND